MTRDDRDRAKEICAADGCMRPVPKEGLVCESCALEWSLYRRDFRERPTAEFAPLVR
jgi:hypothetical protein